MNPMKNRSLEKFYRRFLRNAPAKLVFTGYLLYILIGAILLCLPFVQRTHVKPIDNLFIATSAVSTTGLVTVSVSDSYNFIGQLIILALIQLGGIGYMTLGSFVILSRKAELTEPRLKISRTVFSLPDNFRMDKFIRSVIKFTLLIELVGAVALLPVFFRAGVSNPVWSAVFHSVSSFCTAGFGLYNNSFEDYADNTWLNIVVSILSYIGAMGFIVCVDVYRWSRKKTRAITMTSKVILWCTLWMAVIGSILLFFTEPSVTSLPLGRRILASSFQAMTAMTTVGFNTISIAHLSRASVLLMTILMVIGASPSGTGGGLKTTTFSVLTGVMLSALRGEDKVCFWGRAIPRERVWAAVAGFGFYIFMLTVGVYLLELTEEFNFEQNVFEAASALGTVGLSMGITPVLSVWGKIITTFLMFCGRLGPLTFGIALFIKKPFITRDFGDDLAI